MFLRKCRRILCNGFCLFKKKGHSLTTQEYSAFEKDLRALDSAILNKKRKEANKLALQITKFIKIHFPKSLFEKIKEIVAALGFAIIVAFLIRQFWFELYEVPTGSMRPTIEELDRMIVSKTTFGLKIPFLQRSLFYSNDLIKRAGIIVFTVAGMNLPDSNMRYFYLFPGKKRYVKRAMSKPGDTVYFYGGYLYGIDKNGEPITELSDPLFLKRYGIDLIDHLPYITFDGKMSVSQPIYPNIYESVEIKQMNQSIGKMSLKPTGKIEGYFYDGKKWVLDRPEALTSPHDTPVSYSEMWGIRNYAMARLLTKEQAKAFYEQFSHDPETILYLELKHTPNFAYPKPEMRQDELGRIHPMVTPMTALIPLYQTHLDAIQKALFTARFYVKSGHAYRYHEQKNIRQPLEFDPKFPNVPDGLYEFYYGLGYKIHKGGIRTALPSNHPLYNQDPDTIRKLFNLGIGFNMIFEPVASQQPYNPQRFAFYRDGDLYLMGMPVFKKHDPVLMRFVTSEQEKEEASLCESPYIAFIDRGPPIKDGVIDRKFIETFGLKIPDHHLLALGDNYAMSADSRDFGFVPTEKLRGAPLFTFWPPGKRIGLLPQPYYDLFTIPKMVILFFIIIGSFYYIFYIRKTNKRSLFDKKD
ncbi:MAG: signal peptidase I [Chlamydiales bacterium]